MADSTHLLGPRQKAEYSEKTDTDITDKRHGQDGLENQTDNKQLVSRQVAGRHETKRQQTIKTADRMQTYTRQIQAHNQETDIYIKQNYDWG